MTYRQAIAQATWEYAQLNGQYTPDAEFVIAHRLAVNLEQGTPDPVPETQSE
jgi:hypothetical protein